jgi:hypothetical protein
MLTRQTTSEPRIDQIAPYMYTTGMNNKPVVTELNVDEALLFQIMDAAEAVGAAPG